MALQNSQTAVLSPLSGTWIPPGELTRSLHQSLRGGRSAQYPPHSPPCRSPSVPLLICCLNHWHWDPPLSGAYLLALWVEHKDSRAGWFPPVGKVQGGTVPTEDSWLASGSENSPLWGNCLQELPHLLDPQGYWHYSQGLYCPAPRAAARGPANTALKTSMASGDAAMAGSKSAGLLEYLEDKSGFSALPYGWIQ